MIEKSAQKIYAYMSRHIKIDAELTEVLTITFLYAIINARSRPAT